MFFLINLFLLVSSTKVIGECNGSCKVPTQIYDSLKCKPVFEFPDFCCPSKYDCSHIEEHARLDQGNCFFHGKLYNEGEHINNDEVLASCRASCSCRKSRSGQTGFTCALFDCPMNRPQPGCKLKYQLDQCCATDVVCPPFSVTCEVNGKVYHEGEQFTAPDNKCTKCMCQKGFEGKFEAPFCINKACVDEVGYQTQIKKFCAPSYINIDDCCPYNWICPDTNDSITRTKNPSKSRNHKCRFGQNIIDIGGSFERTDVNSGGKLSCECKIPPFLTCIQDCNYPRTAAIDY